MKKNVRASDKKNTATGFTSVQIDETLRETISHGTPDYPFRFYDENMDMFDFRCIDWHCHFYKHKSHTQIYFRTECNNSQLSVFSSFYFGRRHSDLSKKTLESENTIRGQGQLQMMMQFIQQNYSENITLEEIARSVKVSKSTALNIFADVLKSILELHHPSTD